MMILDIQEHERFDNNVFAYGMA